MHDIKFAFRQLLKNPGFSFVAIATLALGIGANTTIFSTINALFLQPMPVKEPDRLVMVMQKSAVWNMLHGHSWLDYLDYRQRAAAFADTAAFMLNPVHLGVAGQRPEHTWIEAVSANYFSMLGVEPGLGRLFRRDEDAPPGGNSVIVLSRNYWRGKLGADLSIVGKTMTLNGHPYSVIGVTPESFVSAQWAISPAAYVPASMIGQVRDGGDYLLRERGAEGAFNVMARLKPGVTLAQARASAEVVASQLSRDYPDQHKQARVFVFPERLCRPDPAVCELMPLVGTVFSALGLLVLLIACANVANLMLSRALVRQKELGIRAALGATRWRLLRQLLAESVIMGVIAGGLGCLLAYWTSGLVSGFNPVVGDIPVRAERAWDWRVFFCAFAVSVLGGVVTALAPAWRATRIDAQTTLKEGGAAGLGSRRHPLRGALVVAQVAICVVVLVAGGLLLRGLQRVARLDLGFRSDHLLMASIDPGLQGYDGPKQKEFYLELADRLKALPGVRSASLARNPPFDTENNVAMVAPEEKAADKDSFTSVLYNPVDPDYLPTMGTTLLAGRNFDGHDIDTAPKAAIVNAFMAEKLWPGRDPLGKRFKWGQGGELWQVVGVARNAKYFMIAEEPRPFFYAPLAQNPASRVTLHMWTSAEPAALAGAVQETLRRLDPGLPLYNVRTMEQHLHDSILATMPLRLGAGLAGVMGLLALLLAVMGLYGVVSYFVGQRTREIGMRMALGTQKLDILRLVARDGLRLAGIGLALGLLGAVGLGRVFQNILFGLTPSTAPVLAAVVLLLAAVAALACYIPARRAARVDPLAALRCE
jgi:predicted permease